MIVDLLPTFTRFAFGLSVFAGLMAFMLYRSSYRWRYLAERYGPPASGPVAEKQFQNAVLYGHGPAYNSYNGIVTIGVLNDGVVLRLFRPFSIFHKPLFIPFKDIQGWKQRWYLNAPSVELEFASAPDVKILMPKDQVSWLGETMGAPISLSDDTPPENSRPTFTYAATITLAVLSLSLGAALIAQFLGFGPWAR